MSFSIKDFATGLAVAIKSTFASGAHIPHHIVESSALPAGASTEAKQDTGNTSLAAILAKLSADPATDTTLAAAAASIISALGGVAGTVTANAGTNLNTSALALESGGNLAAIAASVAAATPSGANLIGRASASLETSTIYNATTALTPKFAKIACSSSGANEIVAAVASKKIRVLAYNFMAADAVNAKWQSDGSPTDLTGLKYLDDAGAGIVAPFNPLGWFETIAGEALDLNLSGAIAVGGELVYVEV